jgi:hypothetical protein
MSSASSVNVSLPRVTLRRQRANKAKGARKGRTPSIQPPVINTTVRARHRFRFVCAVGSSTGVTLKGSDLCTALNAKTSGSTTTSAIISSCRMLRADLYWQYNSQASGGSEPSQIAVQPGLSLPQVSTNVSDNCEESKSSIVLGVAQPGHVTFVPPARSVSAAWHDVASTLPVITINTGGTQYSCVLDIWLDFTLSDDKHTGSVFFGTSGSSTSVGSLSFTGFNPVGYQPQ